jgi:hypothetical protein
MISCEVFRSNHASFEDQLAALGFKGNKPALPPLTTESVTSIIYLVDEEPTVH